MTGKTLAEKQMYYYNGHRCPYCDGLTDLVDSSVIHFESHGNIYYCKKCDSAVGTKHGDLALGCLAKKNLRNLRIETHKAFEPLIFSKVNNGVKIKTARIQGLKWVAELLGISSLEAHFGYLSESQCRKIIDECKKYHLSTEQIAEREQKIKDRVELINLLAGIHEFEVKEFKINNAHQLELIHPVNGRIYFYKPKEQMFSVPKSKKVGASGIKWVKTADTEIEAFVEKHFKQ